jgi:hypothetical protein
VPFVQKADATLLRNLCKHFQYRAGQDQSATDLLTRITLPLFEPAVPAFEILFHQGDVGEHFYSVRLLTNSRRLFLCLPTHSIERDQVLSGSVAIYHVSTTDDEDAAQDSKSKDALQGHNLMTALKEGQWFGEVALTSEVCLFEHRWRCFGAKPDCFCYLRRTRNARPRC